MLGAATKESTSECDCTAVVTGSPGQSSSYGKQLRDFVKAPLKPMIFYPLKHKNRTYYVL